MCHTQGVSTIFYCTGLISHFTSSRKADIEAQDVDSYTPLLTAVANGQKRAMEVLIERGATLDVIDRDGKSIVFIAAEKNHEDILEVWTIHLATFAFIPTTSLYFSLPPSPRTSSLDPTSTLELGWG